MEEAQKTGYNRTMLDSFVQIQGRPYRLSHIRMENLDNDRLRLKGCLTTGASHARKKPERQIPEGLFGFAEHCFIIHDARFLRQYNNGKVSFEMSARQVHRGELC